MMGCEMKKRFYAVVLAMLPATLFAQEPTNYQCSLDEVTRRVEILYETGVRVPCEVHYYKDTEAPGERQVLWRAANEEGYCEAKATEFVAKLESMGWTCWTPSDSSTAEPEEADDTDALAPADDIEIPASDPPQ
jgi:hypothetical protein